MTTQLINKDAFKEMFGKALNEEMMKAAEPLMKEFLDKMEKEMRANIAANLIKFISSDYDFMVDKERIVIKVGSGRL